MKTGHGVAIVTGGTRGRGASLSRGLVKRDYQVVATYRSDEHSARAFERAFDIPAVNADVTSPQSCTSLVSHVEKRYGPIAVLVNNAGIHDDGKVEALDLAAWQAVLDINLTGSFQMVQAVLPGMSNLSANGPDKWMSPAPCFACG